MRFAGSHLRTNIARWTETASVCCLGALLVTLPFWRHRVLIHRGSERLFFEFHDVILYTNDLLWLAALGLWLASRLLHSAASRLRVGPWFLFGPLAGLFLASLASIPFAIDPLYAGYQSVRMFLLVISYLMVANLSLSPGMVGWPLAAAMVLQASVALPQFALGRSLGLRRLGEVSTRAGWPGASVVMVGEQRWLRAYGLAQHPNLLAGCLIAMILIVSGFYLCESGWRRIPLLIALGSGLGALLLTFSRAAWLGMLGGSAVMVTTLWWAHRQKQWSPEPRSVLLLAGGLGACVAVFLALGWPLLQPRLGLTYQGVEVRSVDARLLQLKAARELIRLRPISGVGVGNYATALFTLAPELVADYPVYQPVHNVLFLATAELGILGGVLWLWLVLAPWLALWLRRQVVCIGPWWAGVNGALASLGAVSFLDSYVWSAHQTRLLLWLVLGLWAAAWERGVAPNIGPNSGPLQRH